MSKFRDTINREMEGFQLSDDIKMSVINSRYTHKKKAFKPLLVAIGSLCIASVLTVGVGTIACGSFSEFANGVNIVFTPVNETCTSNGIELSVVSAGIDSVKNKTMSAYVTLKDTTDLDRITQDSRLGCWVKSASEGNPDIENVSTSVEMTSFDETTHTATYKIVASMDWWYNFANKNTIYCNSIFNGEDTQTTIAKDIDLYSLAKDNLEASYTYYDTNYDYTVKCINNSGYYGCYKTSSIPDIKLKSIMENIEPIQVSDDLQLIGIGFIDGHLHIKLNANNCYDAAVTDDETNTTQYINNENYRLLTDDGKDPLNTEEYSSLAYEYYLSQDGRTIELCFPRVNDISKLEDLKLSYDTHTYNYIEGTWSATFKVNDNTQEP